MLALYFQTIDVARHLVTLDVSCHLLKKIQKYSKGSRPLALPPLGSFLALCLLYLGLKAKPNESALWTGFETVSANNDLVLLKSFSHSINLSLDS